MMRWLLVAVVAYALFAAFGDRLTNSARAQNVDNAMQKIAQELNEKLPMTVGNIRADSVTYADHVMHYAGTTLPGKELTDDDKRLFRQKMRDMYCGKALAKASVGVEYVIKVSPRFDDTRPRPWTATIGPGDCA